MRNRLMFAVMLMAPLAVAGCKEDKPKAPDAMPVKVGAPISKKLTEWDEFTGRFRAKDRVEVRARASGYLSEIRFTDGQDVKQGDVLFVIDQRPYKIALERAQAEEIRAQKVMGRTKSLHDVKAVSQQELETADQQYIAAKTMVEDAKLNLEFTEVRAPISGRVSRHLVDAGNLVSGGDTGSTMLTTVVSEDPIYFYFEANEQDILKYIKLDREGKRESSRKNHRSVYVKVGDEKEFAHVGKIDFVDNEIDRETGTLQERAEFANTDGSLLPGTFGRARLAGSGEYVATLVPDDVIGTNQTTKFVYVVNDKNEIEPHPVTLGPLHDNNMRIIRDGLKPDDKIVMAGVAMLHPGMKVNPQSIDAPIDGTTDGAKPADTKNDDEKKATAAGKDVDADDESDGDDKKLAAPKTAEKK